MNIPIRKIEAPNRILNKRDDESIYAKVDSLRKLGWIQPLAVVKAGDCYRLLDEDDREYLEAAETLGMKEVPCFVRTEDPLTETLLCLAKTLNHNSMIDIVAIGQTYFDLTQKSGLNVNQISEMTGAKNIDITAAITVFLDLEPSLKGLIHRRNGLTIQEAKFLAKLPVPDQISRAQGILDHKNGSKSRMVPWKWHECPDCGARHKQQSVLLAS